MAPPTYLYVNQVGQDGWVNGKGRDGSFVPLCKYTKVEVKERKDLRTYFEVLDGPQKGALLSMADHNAATYLGVSAPAKGVARITVTYGQYVEHWVSQARHGQQLDQQFAQLKVEGVEATVTMNSVWGREFAPLPPGNYNVFVPDSPHAGDMTTFYRDVAPTLIHDQVWFPIQYGDNSRYVHVGNLSDGCVTVISLALWPRICEALLSHRSEDGRFVASLSVLGHPQRAR